MMYIEPDEFTKQWRQIADAQMRRAVALMGKLAGAEINAEMVQIVPDFGLPPSNHLPVCTGEEAQDGR